MARFHINPETGNPGTCKAMLNCPFGDLEADHYDSRKAAQTAYESKMAAEALQPLNGPSYSMPAWRVAEALASIEKANKKAEKAGIPERFTYTVEEWTRTSVDRQGFTVLEDRATVTLNRPVVKHEGWTFAGTMSWDPEAGLITRMAPGQELTSRPEAELCDVCKTVRHRNDTYIVQKDGEQKQVGSNCLKRFMGIEPTSLWMMDFEVKLKDHDDDDPRFERERVSAQRRPNEEIIALGLAFVKEHGWLSKSAAYERGDGAQATASRLDLFLTTNTTSEEDRKAREAMKAKAKEFKAEAAEVLKHAKLMDGESEYAINLRAIANSDTVDMRNMPLLLSAIGNYQRDQERARAAAAAPVSNWVGAVKERLTNKKVTVETVKPYTSHYGYQESTSLLIIMRDEDGNSFKTFYSGSDTVEAGNTYTLKGGTVKAHEEWQGTKSTVLSRVKLIDGAPATPPKPAPTAYGEAATTEELDEVYKGNYKKIRLAMKEKAGLAGWDEALNRPHEQTLADEWRALVKTEDEAYDKFYSKVTEE